MNTNTQNTSSLDSSCIDRYSRILDNITTTTGHNNTPVVASLYSRSSTQSPRAASGFSSVSFSPVDPSYGVASGKDLLHILRVNLDKSTTGGSGSRRLEEIRSVRISQNFQSALQTTNAATGGQNPQYPHVRDALRLPGSAASPASSIPSGGGGGININITDVAWSLSQTYVLDTSGHGNTRGRDAESLGDSYEELLSPEYVHDIMDHDRHYPRFIQRRFDAPTSSQSSMLDDTSIVAAAGSNGVITAWNAYSLLSSPSQTSNNSSGAGGSGGQGSGVFYRKNTVESASQQVTSGVGHPEASFLAHSRAVNRLSWHPTGRRPYLLLTASQDGSCKLWDRRATSSSSTIPRGSDSGAGFNTSASQSTTLNTLSAKSWFGFGGAQTVHQNTQQPLLAMNHRTATWHCVSTYQPKCDGVRDIQWNPFLDDVFAMVAGEWLVVYDIRINGKPMMKESTHAGDATSLDWHPSRKYTIATGGRDRSVKVWDLENGLNVYKQGDASTNNMTANSGSFRSENSETLSATSHSSSDGPISANNETSERNIHSNKSTVSSQSNLSTGSNSPVKRSGSSGILSHSRHLLKKKLPPLHVLNIAAPVTRLKWKPADDSLIAVATSSIYGANAGGHGNVGLWSIHRPFMPISVLEGHTEGAVTDFAWAEDQASIATIEEKQSNSVDPFVGKWKTVLTVGRDGQCLLQDFTYGDRPILDVPRGCVAVCSLSPFQPGFGSLQIMSVHQNVHENSSPLDLSKSKLVFSITDQGDVDDLSKASLPATVDVAPELTHLSRFSELYVTTIGGEFASKADVCRHNANVAKGLSQKALRQMWKTLATILDGSTLDGLPTSTSEVLANPMANLLTPTLSRLLVQRANAGDVVTCVTLCEVMDVIAPPTAAGGSAKSRIPNLSIALIREWYLTYIDLLQQMCLFTQAANLIKNCSDPVVGALNQQSTTIHEACPKCGKPLIDGNITGDAGSSRLSAQRVCRSCRGRVGMCFLCHEPVNGIFVWCPGCGHGGHLEHALEWFGKNEVCPTGCGHKCNLFKKNIN